MSTRMKNVLWFLIPALVTAGGLLAISTPSIDGLGQEVGAASPAEPIIALVLFAFVGGAIIGGIFYGLRQLSTLGKRSESGDGSA